MSSVPNLMCEQASGSPPATLPCAVCRTQSRCEAGFADIRLFRCPQCQHCFTDLGSLEREEQYRVQYFDEDHKNWNKHADLRLFERIYRLILRNRANASVLDVGCGKGNFLRYLRKRDPRLLLAGIDMSPNEYCDGIEFLCGDFLSWKFNQKFDVVVSLQVIEHVSDPRMFVRRVLDLCSDSALVITNTINEQSVLYDAARLARSLRCIRAYERLYSRHHLNHFNISSLRRLMESMGLKTERHLRHRAPVSAMDIPAPNKFMELVFRAGVWGTFVVGDLTGRSTYQTTICRK